MSKIPKENSFDSTLSLLKEGYTFIPSRRKRLQSDIFQTRLMGKKVICMGAKKPLNFFMTLQNLKEKERCQNGLRTPCWDKKVFKRWMAKSIIIARPFLCLL